MDETQTRLKLINPRLRLAGWNLEDPGQVIQELDVFLAVEPGTLMTETIDPFGGHGFTDYALFRHGHPLAVVEAKKTSKNAEIGREQALQYAQALQGRYGTGLPFVFYTNGHEHHFWDSELYPPARIFGFPTPEELEWMRERAGLRRPLSVELINTSIAGWDFQIAAIRTILEAVEARRRKFLLVMATGTGKTRTATALIDVLRRAKWVQRVLFLVDRVALRDQALEVFGEHIPAEPRWPQREGNRIEQEFARNRRLYVATYPAMLNLILHDQTPAAYVSPFFFDLVIADESHRSIYDVYQQVLNYFHALKLGLTATPKDHVDFDTFRLFDCEANRPTFAYSYEEAVGHIPPYLCEFEVLDVRSKFQVEGIHGGELAEESRDQLRVLGIEPEQVDFEGTDLEKRVTNAATNALIVREFMEEAIKDFSGVLPGKSIVFALSKAHAYRLEEIFNRLYPELAGKLVRVLVSEDPRVHGKGGLLDQFKTRDFPRVAISVDMLDTGVDVREVVNLVFAKPVWSYTKFWQMIGRGTRILESDRSRRRSWCPEKDRFLILDCWRNFEYFKMNPKGCEPGRQVPLPVRLFRARLEKLEAAWRRSEASVAEEVKRELRADLEALPSNNVVVLENQAHLAAIASDSYWAALRASDLPLLRNTIAPILRARSSADLKGLLFEIDVVEAGSALLSGDGASYEALRESLVEQIAELPLTVNLVAREKQTIDAALEPDFWLSPSDDALRSLTFRLGPLMRFRQRRPEPLMKLDLADMLAVKEAIEFGPEHERLPSAAYRREVEEYVCRLAEANPVLRKLRDGEAVSEVELHELAGILAAQRPYVTEERLRQVYDHKSARLPQLLRHVLGAERLPSWRETVTRAFDSFIAEHNTLTSLQIRFLQTLRTFVLQTGRVEKKDLVAPPFTQLHPEGIRGVFRPAEIDAILELSRSLVA